jgi:hypothetical protein
MKLDHSPRRLTAAITLLSGLLGLACIAVGVHLVRGDFEAFADPSRLLAKESVSGAELRAFMVLDLLGYYLLLAPAILHVHSWLSERTSWASTLTFGGLGYVLVGAIGASILAVVWPLLLDAHAAAAPDDRPRVVLLFRMMTEIVYGGMWNLLEVLLGGAWWLGVGLAWPRSQWKLRWLTIVSGVFPLADGVAGVLRLASLHEIALNGYLVTGIVWPIAFAVDLLRSSDD